MPNLTDPFTNPLEEQRERIDIARQALDAGEKETEGWPELERMISDDTIPTLQDWIAKLQREKQPIDLDLSHIKKQKTEDLGKITRHDPRTSHIRQEISKLSRLMEEIEEKIGNRSKPPKVSEPVSGEQSPAKVVTHPESSYYDYDKVPDRQPLTPPSIRPAWLSMAFKILPIILFAITIILIIWYW